jgi:alpha-ketoglutarate-dependent taurine dioxygenase
LTDATALTFRPQPSASLPVIAEPRTPGVPLDMWISANAAVVRSHLDTCGAVLFRGFAEGAAALRHVVEATGGASSLDYQEAATPRTRLGDGVYTSTDYPAHQRIELHNEGCYSWSWPRVVGFACVLPATTGGETPLADCRGVLRRLPVKLTERLARHGVRYIRNFTARAGTQPGTVVPSEPAELSEFASSRRLCAQWLAPDHVRTTAWRPALIRHPGTGEWCWFNQATSFHLSTIGAQLAGELLGELGPDHIPKTTKLGDGSDFSDEDLAAIRSAFTAETTTFDWRAGDVLVVDNLLIAHGREPYAGKREVHVAMSQPGDWGEFETRPDIDDEHRGRLHPCPMQS